MGAKRKTENEQPITDHVQEERNLKIFCYRIFGFCFAFCAHIGRHPNATIATRWTLIEPPKMLSLRFSLKGDGAVCVPQIVRICQNASLFNSECDFQLSHYFHTISIILPRLIRFIYMSSD